MGRDFKLCEVCNVPGNGCHFGVDACRGCTAFFRRTIVQKKEYTCNGDKSCDIPKSEGLLCRKCRFEKCLEVGMKKESVQTNRDVYGKRAQELKVNLIVPSAFRLKFPVSVPFLSTITNNYAQLKNVRLIVHKDEGDSVFKPRVPRRLTYKQTNKLLIKEFYLVADWISNSFAQFSGLPKDQRDILMRNFYLQFYILEAGFIGCTEGRNNVFFLPNGDYIDCQNLASFYHDEDGQQPMTSEEAAIVYKGSCSSYRRNVTTPMLRENVDEFEFLAMAALILFDAGLEGQSNSCIELCRNVRSTIQREMIQYYSANPQDESAIRIGNLLSILPNLQKATHSMQNDLELSYLFNSYSVDNKFYENCVGKS